MITLIKNMAFLFVVLKTKYMKRNYVSIIVMFLYSCVIFSQDLQIHKISGEVITIPINNIDSIVFLRNDDLFSRDTAGTFVDKRDGEKYKWVKIGTQIWMAENLKYLPKVDSPENGSEDSGFESSQFLYVYNYNGNNVEAAKTTSEYLTYGVLYNWYAAMNGSASSENNPSGIQGVCPDGWHLPSDNEWKSLESELGMVSNDLDKITFRGYDQGSKMKSITGWNGGGNGTNLSNLNVFPAGIRYVGQFIDVGKQSSFWSSTESELYNTYRRRLTFENEGIDRNGGDKDNGYSIRCIKD